MAFRPKAESNLSRSATADRPACSIRRISTMAACFAKPPAS